MRTNQADACLIMCVMLLISRPIGLASAQRANESPASQSQATKIIDRVSCSSLCQAKHPLDSALTTIAGIGYRYVDLAALSWCAHVSPASLVSDFDKEASRVEAALAASHLQVSNFTFDAMQQRAFPEYKEQFAALVRFAVRTKARLINIMAPGAKADRQDAVAKLRELQTIARSSGIILTLETHTNQLTEKPTDAVWICRQVPGLALTLDPGHYYAGPNQGANFDEIYPLVQGTGLRAGGMSWAMIQLPWGEGPIDFEKIIQKLERTDYKGFYEAEYIEGFNGVDALRESRRFLEWMKTTFGR